MNRTRTYRHEHGGRRFRLYSLRAKIERRVDSASSVSAMFGGVRRRETVLGWFCPICGFVPGYQAQRLMLEAQGLAAGIDSELVRAVEYDGYGTKSREFEAPGVSFEDATEQRRERSRRVARLGYAPDHAPALHRDVLPGA